LLSDDLLHLLSQMLCFNPAKRISAAEALRHPYFSDCEEALADEGDAVQPDDGEGQSIDDMMRLLKTLRLSMRLRRGADDHQSMLDDLPGM
jgi:serine/threonine protein kinase